eukprot:scaffold105906_cov25-Attheya_sp.AAC.1
MKCPFTSNTFQTTASKEMAGIKHGTTDSKSEANTNYATHSKGSERKDKTILQSIRLVAVHQCWHCRRHQSIM